MDRDSSEGVESVGVGWVGIFDRMAAVGAVCHSGDSSFENREKITSKSRANHEQIACKSLANVVAKIRLIFAAEMSILRHYAKIALN